MWHGRLLQVSNQMASLRTGPDPLIEKVCKALGLKNVISITISVAADRLSEVTVRRFLSIDEMQQIVDSNCFDDVDFIEAETVYWLKTKDGRDRRVLAGQLASPGFTDGDIAYS